MPRNEGQRQITDVQNFASMVIEKRNKMMNADLMMSECREAEMAYNS